MILAVTSGWIRARCELARRPPVSGVEASSGEQAPRARILEVTAVEYHRDPCQTPSLSSGVACTLISETPAHAYAQHPRLGASGSSEDDPTKAMQEGTLIHRLMLGVGRDVVIIEAPNYRTKDAQEQRDHVRAAGKIPVLQYDFAEKAAIAAILRDRCAALGYPFDGQSELAVEWHDECADGTVLCRSMFDHVHVDRGVIYDLKRVESAHPRRIARNYVEYGWDIQHACYIRALERLRPEFQGRVDFTFLLVEIKPPYSVVPVKPDGPLREIGTLRWERAVQLWHGCLTSGEWPGYTDGPALTLEAPPWVVTSELGTW